MKNLTLIFNDVEDAHLGKDVFLTPYYIAREYNLKLNVVFPSTETNRNLTSNYRGAKFIRKKFLYTTKKISILRELNFYIYIFFNNKKIDNLMLFHLSLKSMLQTILYKYLNPKGKCYVKLDININGLNNCQNYKINNLKRRIFMKIVNLFFKKVDLISCETLEIYQKIISKGLYGINIKDKLDYIPNGFDDELLKNLDIKIKAYKEKENIMITVGRLGSYEKNNEMLLNAIDKVDIKDWKILLIGPFDDKFEQKYNEFIRNNKDKKTKVLLVGNISDKKKLFEYYNKAKVFILTSRSEGFALVYPEALKFGDYILTTDVGGAKDITENSKVGKIIPVEEPKILKEEIEKIIKNKINLQKKYEESLKLSEKNFLWSNIIKKSKKMKELFDK